MKPLRLQWPIMNIDARVDAIQAVCKDPNDAQELALVDRWEDLPSYVTSNLKEVR